ncbi:hypothetical protein C9374_011441 [Naegleria lovaniensis]|uniref:Uncharacterized protein n=1 Tax=Naegleria lovaniensis TaxID=51637 RepID=A0AA88H2H3_NAELO|nr:uncharacterized protein C9374_011441 [Naegleria lovaniensis]KAG2392716.1 hypothetical protein C9374_011441 [Naegleria lovaniensis]
MLPEISDSSLKSAVINSCKFHVPPQQDLSKQKNVLTTPPPPPPFGFIPPPPPPPLPSHKSMPKRNGKNPIDFHVHSQFIQSQLSDVMIGILPSSYNHLNNHDGPLWNNDKDGFAYPAHKVVLIQAFRLKKYILQRHSSSNLNFIHLHDAFSVYDFVGRSQDDDDTEHSYEHFLRSNSNTHDHISPGSDHVREGKQPLSNSSIMSLPTFSIQEDCFLSALSILYGQDVALLELTQEYAFQVFDLLLRMGAYDVAARWIEQHVELQEQSVEHLYFALLLWKRCFQEESYLKWINRTIKKQVEFHCNLIHPEMASVSSENTGNALNGWNSQTASQSGTQAQGHDHDEDPIEISKMISSVHKLMHDVIHRQLLQEQLRASCFHCSTFSSSTNPLTGFHENIKAETMQERVLYQVISTSFSLDQLVAFIETVCCPYLKWGPCCEMIMKWALHDENRCVLYLGDLLLRAEKAFKEYEKSGAANSRAFIPPPPPSLMVHVPPRHGCCVQQQQQQQTRPTPPSTSGGLLSQFSGRLF